MYEARITRVRMEAEASTAADCERALNEAFGVIFHGIVRAVEAGGLRGDSGEALVFPRESEFGEVVLESKVREDGAVYFAGRKLVLFNGPPLEEPSEDHDPSLATLPRELVDEHLDALANMNNRGALSQNVLTSESRLRAAMLE